LLPRDESGHQFVFYGDCCSGIPGAQAELNLAAVNAVVRQLKPEPEFICFLGDHIAGYPEEREALRSQWRYWLDHEMAWAMQRGMPLYHVTSNHNTANADAEAVWREIFTGLPQNGPAGQGGLSYAIRRGNLLLVGTNSAYSGLGGLGHVESTWLDQVLMQHADAPYKLVLGHYPVFPVNGYDLYPTWRIVPSEGEAFWNVLVKHGVLAYLCSHVIAFDVQAHEGVLQITSGGAGTFYGPGNFMPGQTEYLHAVQAAVDQAGLRYQVLDTRGHVCESLIWPMPEPDAQGWEPITSAPWRPHISPWAQLPSDHNILFFRFSGACTPSNDDQTLLCGWSYQEASPNLWIGLQHTQQALRVSLVPESGDGPQTWHGPAFPAGQPFAFDLAIHLGMGPGGVLWRANERAPWSSLMSSSALGALHMPEPESWLLGHAPNSIMDRPYCGSRLQAAFTLITS
jgi:hypothetical protein